MKSYRMFNLAMAVIVLVFTLAACSSGSSGSGDDNKDGEDSDGDSTGCFCAFGCNPDGSCMSQPCDEDTDCPIGYFCDDGKCVDPDNPADGDSGSSVDPDGDKGNDNIPPKDDLVDAITDVEWETGIPHDEKDPWIQVSDIRIIFGAIPIGSEDTKYVTVTNNGLADLVIDDIYIYYDGKEDNPEIWPAHDELPITILPSESVEIGATYGPQDLDKDKDVLVIHSNDPAEPNFGVAIYTDVKAFGDLAVEPTAVHFGVVRPGNHREKFKIINRGGLDARIFSITLAEGTEGVFSLEGFTPGEEFTIDASRSKEITINYSPESADGVPDETIVTIISDDEKNPTIQVPVTGTSCIPAAGVNPTALSFTVEETGGIDNQCSTLKNEGCEPLEITNIEVTDTAGGAFSMTSGFSFPFTLPFGHTEEICIQYSPTSESQTTGNVTVESNDPDNAIIDIPLSSTYFRDPMVIGHFTNVITGDPIPGLFWELQDFDTGSVVDTSDPADATGTAPMRDTYPIDKYIGHVPGGEHGGLVCPDMEIQLLANKTVHVYFSCQPELIEGSMRIVLRWDNSNAGGADLDAHLFMPNGGHVYFSNPTQGAAQLDHDGGIQPAPTEFSPETMTINSFISGKYCFAIHDYNYNSGPWHGINTVVDVFDNNGLVQTINGPAQNASGGWWRVIEIDGATQTITTVDVLGSSQPSCN